MKKFFTFSVLGVLLALFAPLTVKAASATFKVNDATGIYMSYTTSFYFNDFSENEFTITSGGTYDKRTGGTFSVGTASPLWVYSKAGYTLKSVKVDGVAKTINQNVTIYPDGGGYAGAVSGVQKCNVGSLSALDGKTVEIEVEANVVETKHFTLDIEGDASLYTAKFENASAELNITTGTQEIEFTSNENTLVLAAKNSATYKLTTVTLDGKAQAAAVHGYFIPITDGCTVKMVIEESAAKDIEVTFVGATEALDKVVVAYKPVEIAENKFTVTEGEQVKVYFNEDFSNITVTPGDGEAVAVENAIYNFVASENVTLNIAATAPTTFNVTVRVDNPAAFTVRRADGSGEIVELQAGDNTVALLNTSKKDGIFWSLNPGFGVDTSAAICEGMSFTAIANDSSEDPRFPSPFSLVHLTEGSVVNLVSKTYDFDKQLVVYCHENAADRGMFRFYVSESYSIEADKATSVSLSQGYQVMNFCDAMLLTDSSITGFNDSNDQTTIYLNGSQISHFWNGDLGTFAGWGVSNPKQGDVYKIYPGKETVEKSKFTLNTSDKVKNTVTVKADLINTIDHAAAYETMLLPGTLISIEGTEDIAVKVNGEYIQPAEAVVAANEQPAVVPMGRNFVLSVEEGKSLSVKVENSEDIASGIDSVMNDSLYAPVEYFNLQGTRVANPEKGGLYVRRQGSSVAKVLVK